MYNKCLAIPFQGSAIHYLQVSILISSSTKDMSSKCHLSRSIKQAVITKTVVGLLHKTKGLFYLQMRLGELNKNFATPKEKMPHLTKKSTTQLKFRFHVSFGNAIESSLCHLILNRRFRNKCDIVEEPNSSSKHGIIVKFFSLITRNLVF